jgi:hypothetical protein
MKGRASFYVLVKGPTTKRTDERHLKVLVFQIDVSAAHSVPRLIGRHSSAPLPIWED